jgi:hypothetical protein
MVVYEWHGLSHGCNNPAYQHYFGRVTFWMEAFSLREFRREWRMADHYYEVSKNKQIQILPIHVTECLVRMASECPVILEDDMSQEKGIMLACV